jgi:tetratricopeptide (TPR) repeat protein
MTENSARYCSGCGTPASPGAAFCSACGARLSTERPASVGDRRSALPLPGLVVLVGFLAVGLGLWVALLAPRKPPSRMPLAQQQPAEGGAPASGLPQDHPPLEIPVDVKKYIADLEAKAAAQPKDLATWKAVAQVEYRAGQIDRSFLDKAEASFRHVLDLDRKDVEALRGLGNVHFDRREYREAIESYERYIALKPDDLGVHTDLGTMYLYGGDPDKAIAQYRQVLAKDPKFYQAQYNIGMALAQKGETAQALEALERAREVAPDERTRRQIDATIDQAKGGERRGGAAGAPKGFHDLVEEALRSHPILGPKIAKLEWPSPTNGRLVLRQFPIEGMPDAVRRKFLDRLKTVLAEAKQRSGQAGAAKLDLVDDSSGDVMATVDAE